jgi:matrixin
MRKGPIRVVPPGEVPPRPDQPEPSRTPLFIAFLFLLLVAIVLGAFAIASLLREPAEIAAPPPIQETTTPSPTPTATAAGQEGSFRFLKRVGGDPVRWNPCETITYAVNTGGASRAVLPDLREALEHVTDATGVEFKAVGTTHETFFSAYQRMRYRGVIRKAELILIWVGHEEYGAILRRLGDPRPSIAFAKTMAGLYANRDQYFGGIIVVDADATSIFGFDYTFAHGVVLLHELGHIMGLDHVKDPNQLMYSGRHPNFGLQDYGPGDLEGLRRVGEEAGCLG